MVIKEIKKNKDKGNNMKVNDEIMNKVMKQCEEDGKKNPIISKDLINKNKEGKKSKAKRITLDDDDDDDNDMDWRGINPVL